MCRRGLEKSQRSEKLQKAGRGLVHVKPPGLLKLGSSPPTEAGRRGPLWIVISLGSFAFSQAGTFGGVVILGCDLEVLETVLAFIQVFKKLKYS